MTLAHWTRVSDRCPLGYLCWFCHVAAHIAFTVQFIMFSASFFAHFIAMRILCMLYLVYLLSVFPNKFCASPSKSKFCSRILKIKLYLGFYNVKFWARSCLHSAFLNVVDIMTGTRHQNRTTKCMKFPMQKLIFWDTCLMPFFSWLKPGGSIMKNGKLTDQVCFVYRALFILTESAKNHVLNIMN